MNKEYEVIVIGGGPAGLTAGLYTARARLKSLMIEKSLVGGTVAIVDRIENYPGFSMGINGLELSRLMHEQATKYGLETLSANFAGIELQNEQRKVVKTTDGDFIAKAVIIAMGAERRKPGVLGEENFIGRGVSYCATCDADFYEGLPIAVVGGGDAAITEALYLTKFASKVTVIHRRDQLRAGRIIQERAFVEPKIEFLWSTVVDEIEGRDTVNRLRLHQVITGEKSTLDIAGVFMSIGFKPNTNYLRGVLPLDASGHIITSDKMETEVPGIFAAGDVRHNSARQVITAAGDGATAAIYAEKFVTGYDKL